MRSTPPAHPAVSGIGSGGGWSSDPAGKEGEGVVARTRHRQRQRQKQGHNSPRLWSGGAWPLLALAGVVALSAALPVALGETEERINAVVDSQRAGAPRVTFGLRTAPDRYDFEDSHYVQGIAMLAMIGIVIGTVCLLCGMCSCVSRCASRAPKSPNIYTSGQRLWPKIAVFPVTLLIVLGAGLSYKGNEEFGPELGAFLTTLVDNSVSRAALSRDLVATMNSLDSTPSGRKLVLMRLLTLQADEDVVFVRDSERDLLNLNESRDMGMQFGVGLSFFVCFLGILLVLFRNKWLG
jgi:hypothetical protein